MQVSKGGFGASPVAACRSVDNEIGDEGLKAFANAIKPTPTGAALGALSTLSLGGSKIGDGTCYGITAFVEAINGGGLENLTRLSVDGELFEECDITQLSDACTARNIVLIQ